MSETLQTQSWFDMVGEAATRMSLDLRSAIQHSTNTESRIKAFALLHLSVNTNQILASGVWGDTEESAREAALFVVKRCRNHPEDYPEWLKMTATKWGHILEATPSFNPA